MRALRENMPETRLAFDLKLFAVSKSITTENRQSYLEAYALDGDDTSGIVDIIRDGLRLFENVFGFPSRSFVAPNYMWPNYIEEYLSDMGVKYIQGIRIQFAPNPNTGKTEKIGHYSGQKNKHGQVFLIRNCSFEPSLSPHLNSTDRCLKQIDSAFRWGKPAIIASHRLNYIGSIDASNRERNLKQLSELLHAIIKKWPDIKFLTTPELGDIINNHT